jgi:signal transduction histidine kinase/DNA-binding response OmpR family regulator
MPDLTTSTRPSAADCLAGGGDMGALMRATDWSRTVFGPVAQWPQSLRTAISIMLESRFAMVVAWGPDFRFFYNDRYRPILGSKHPASLGAPGAEIFPEVWSVVGTEFDGVLRGGSFAIDDWLLPLDRNGYLENCYFTLSYSPIRDESGGVGGVLAVVAETTGRVEGERRLATLRELARRASDARTPVQACTTAAVVLAANPIDVPFALIYLVEEDGTIARRVCAVGLPPDHPANFERIEIGGAPVLWPLGDVVHNGQSVVVSDLVSRTAPLPGGPYDERTHSAILLPLSRPGLEYPYGVLVAGISPRRALDDRYRGFFELTADHVATAISNAVAIEEARRRAEALAELDRAKTAFFSNVSHEFRTPLTLMLGPVESLLTEAHGPLTVEQRQDVDILRRNAGRLLRLVNALLDFSRIEAGRARACYRPTDAAALTRELAGAFRSAIEHAGIAFDVRCDAVAGEVFLDRDMWEKIVLNLLSNALKFTFAGSIRVELRQVGDHMQLDVRDTGTGIPAAELPHIFERFHRVEGARSRTLEGTGIGLALTHELVRMHGGTITASSRVDQGSTFTVRIPIGSAHLPADRLESAPAPASDGVGLSAFVDEAVRWLPDGALGGGSADPLPTPPRCEGGAHERILVVDDNADMREYLCQLLRGWEVSAVADGVAALEAARTDPPHLIVTDVMMPGLDGFGLLRELRRDPRTAAVPVLMLSARAGEDARVSGLSAGADDYIIKPFAARELIARVGSLLNLSRARREAELQKQHLRALFMQAPIPIVILSGPDHVIELANPMTCRLWGRSETEVLGKPLLGALPELAGQPFKPLLDQVYRTGIPYSGKETPARLDRHGDGAYEDVYLNFVYAPLRGVDGAIEGVLVIAFEVTDEVTARNEMNRLRSAAETANRTKDDFLAMLGHELRNPLAPILTALQLMNLRGETSAVKERTVIDRQVRHLVRLVDDLLDVSRIARGKIDLRQQSVEIADIVASAVETISPLLEGRHHHLEVDVPRGLIVRGDPMRLTQVVMNVLSNAAKYTEPRGQIRVCARADRDAIEIRVRDTGIGISSEMLPRIFDLFTQERQALDRAHGGLGLGLTIVKSLVELHGGSVQALSDGVGHGSELVVRLPAASEASPGQTAGRPAPHAAAPRPRSGRRILVVDDNVDAAHLMAEALEIAGHDTRVAFDGPAAIDAAAEFQPDAALLDLGLPLMDGYELAEQLAAAAAAAPPILVAVTGYGQPSDQERTRAAGFRAHVVKPVDLPALMKLLEELLAAPSSTASSM